MRQNKTLKTQKRSNRNTEKVMKSKKDMREYLFLSWLDNFAYERNNNCYLQNNEEDIKASKPVE